MYFRFGAAIVLVVVISVVGVALEKQSLSYRRAISQQRYRMDVLVEQYAQMRLKAQRLGAPARTIKSLEDNGELKWPKQAAPRTSFAVPSFRDSSPQK